MASKLFKVIDVDKYKKPVTSACYDKQHVCIYLQRFYTIRANNGKITSF